MFLSVAFMSPGGSKSRKRCSKCPEAYHTILSGVPFSKHLPRLADIIYSFGLDLSGFRITSFHIMEKVLRICVPEKVLKMCFHTWATWLKSL